MDDLAWNVLNGPGEGAAPGDMGRTLGMVVKMTRLHDLGLAQLCLAVKRLYMIMMLLKKWDPLQRPEFCIRMFLVPIINLTSFYRPFHSAVYNEGGFHLFSISIFYSSLLNVLFIRRVRFDLSLNIGHKIKAKSKGMFFSSLVRIIGRIFELSKTLTMK